ncbi:MAG: translation elongation factor 4 [Methylacidiphilales bacterium]|nr:translation elongation factor 4 [Candidatus Methylacidiphilales bacterium]
MPIETIRNFSIIAHVDHGKSTLADRFIEICGALDHGVAQNQMLDTLSIERERGITIKSQCVRLSYTSIANQVFTFNLIDTPGHVDFSYEVSRSLSACEGALLVVDATQGVEAQSIANCYTALAQHIEVIPVINKIDVASADCEMTINQIENLIGIEAKNAIRVSAKTGQGVRDLLERVLIAVPHPKKHATTKLQALIIDSWFDNYVGVVSLVRIFSGSIKKKQKIKIYSNKNIFVVEKIGCFTPKKIDLEELTEGEVGIIIAGIRDIHAAPVGDTILDEQDSVSNPIEGFRKIQPRVFAGLYPIDTDDYDRFRDSLLKLGLNDSSLYFEPENSTALGLGFRCGFLGLLHMEIIQERLEREYNHDLITTAPTVVYEVLKKDGVVVRIHNPSELPSPNEIKEIREPFILAKIIVPQLYVGPVMQLCMDRRAKLIKQNHFGSQVSLEFEMPLSEVIMHFFNELKSVSRGFASYDYDFLEYRVCSVMKLDILLNGEKVDALSTIIHKDRLDKYSRTIVERLKELIPRQMIPIAIQSAVGGSIIARSSISALRKNVIAKCYGGDVSRKRKLLEKQKEGKKRMKTFGRVDIPQEAFLSILKYSK